MGNNDRSQWSSGFGFVMAAAGAAVGLGNIWGFPYKLGQGGGFVYLFFYLLFVVVAGYPVLLSEFAIGRHGRLGAVGSYRKIDRRLGFIGFMGIAACFIILAFYSYFGGMILSYVFQYAKELLGKGVTSDHFSYFTGSTVSSVVWHLIFMAITLFIVVRGIEGGIEKCSKIMMPALIVMLVFIAGRSLALPGAGDALEFIFKPDFDKLTLKTVSSALVQVFFSISVGQGIMITYGSYIGRNENLESNAIIVPLIDTAIALLASLVIIPAVFSFGIEVTSGPGLMFEALPRVFARMNGGAALGLLFFLLVFFAALTSSISMLEVPVSAIIERFGMKRRSAAAIVSAAAFLAGIPVCLDMDIFLKYEFVSQYVLMTLGAFLMCLAVVYIWKRESAEREIESGSRFVTRRFWRFAIKYVAPALILFIFLISIGIIKI